MGIEIVEKIEDEADQYVQNVIERGQSVPWWAPENFPRPQPTPYEPPPPPMPAWIDVVAGGGIPTLIGQQDLRRPEVGIQIQEVIYPTTGPLGTPPITEEIQDMSALDSLLNAATTAYSIYQANQQPQQFVSGATSVLNNLGLPLVDVVSQTPPKKGMLYNPVTGKWQMCRRRRKRRLATPTDIKDLASLKGVLGTGKAFEVWIATH